MVIICTTNWDINSWDLEKDYQKYQEVAVNQFKILKENSARKEHNNGEQTPQFINKNHQRLEYYA